MGIEVAALHQMRADFLHPFWFDFCCGAAIQSGGFGELGGHHPFGAFLVQHGTWEYQKFNFARALVVALIGLDADIAEQPRQQRAVDFLVARGNLVGAHAHFGDEAVQLAMDLVPFAQPGVR